LPTSPATAGAPAAPAAPSDEAVDQLIAEAIVDRVGQDAGGGQVH